MNTDIRQGSRVGLLAAACIFIAIGVGVLFGAQDHAELAMQWGGAVAEPGAMIAVDACWALRRGQPHASVATHGGRCAHLTADNDPHSSAVCVPVVAQGTQLGLLSLSGDPQALACCRR